jgi:hypothetical protein
MSEKKMAETKIMLGWRDAPKIGAALDQIAQDQGIDRSDVIRMIVRGYLRDALALNLLNGYGAERK